MQLRNPISVTTMPNIVNKCLHTDKGKKKKTISKIWKSYSVKVRTMKIQFSSVTQSCPALCDPVNCSMPGLPVHHQLPESTQTHVHRVGDAIQLSQPLSSPSSSAPNPSQHQSLFQ